MSTRMQLTAGLVGVMSIVAAAAHAQGGVKTGTLTCNASGGPGFVFGSSRALNCIFAPSGGRPERYTGTIDKFGVDIGYTSAAVIVWGVIAPTANFAPGSLAGNYAGASAGAAVGAGLGANALIGGSNQQFALQPLSIEGQTGLNVALSRCRRPVQERETSCPHVATPTASRHVAKAAARSSRFELAK
jgi:Protein of unknown function (DUF992)